MRRRVSLVSKRAVASDRGAQQIHHVAYQLVQIDALDRAVPLAGVRQHLVDEIGRALSTEEDGAHAVAELARRRNLQRQQIGVSDDAGQQVVEVVSQPAGEHAEALALLLFLDARLERRALGFGADLIGNIPQHDDPRRRVLVPPADVNDAHIVVPRVAIVAAPRP